MILICAHPCHDHAHAAGGREWLMDIIRKRCPAWADLLEELRIPNNSRFTQSDLEEAVNKLETM